MIIFAIDLGNKRIKMKSERGEYSYPSSYLNAEQVAQGGLGSLNTKENVQFQLSHEENNSFLWGPHLEAYNLPERMIDTYARSGRMKQKKAVRILEFALGRLAMDYPESYESPLVVHLTLGLSITDLHQESDTVSVLKALAIGQHELMIDGKKVTLLIPSEDFLSIVPQYMGTVLHLAFNDQFERQSRFSEGRIGVVDIGGGTILVNRSIALNPSPLGDERFEGIQNLIKAIGRRINSTKSFLIEQMLREGEAEGQYIYRPNANASDVKNITPIVQEEIERYTRFTVAPLITENFPDIEEIDSIVMTGGGASLLDKVALRDEIGETYDERLIFSPASELSNVRGFYKGGHLKWCNPSVETPLKVEMSQEKAEMILSQKEENDLKILEAQKQLAALSSELDTTLSSL
jgi:hypothetical protein